MFKHWLPGVCYRNVTFQLVSEARLFQNSLVAHSGVTHTPLNHRTGERRRTHADSPAWTGTSMSVAVGAGRLDNAADSAPSPVSQYPTPLSTFPIVLFT